MATNKELEDFNSYDAEIDDVDEVAGTDVKINPDYYIHTAIVNAQRSLNDPDLKNAFVRFRVWVEHAQDLAEAANMVTDNYFDEVKKIKVDLAQEYGDEWATLPDYVKNQRFASRKLKYLMKQVFSNKVSTSPIRA